MVSFLCKPHSHPPLVLFIHGFVSLQVSFSSATPLYLFLNSISLSQRRANEDARDEWVRAAMKDHAVVVELLVGLK
jgi:hypothetical protein